MRINELVKEKKKKLKKVQDKSSGKEANLNSL